MDLSEALVVKDGNVFAITPPDGSLPGDAADPYGVWMDDCRHLDGHRIRVGGREPRLRRASDAAGSGSVHELLVDGRELRLERRLDAGGTIVERLEGAGDEIEIELSADLAPMLGLRGILPMPARDRVRTEPLRGGLRFSATGADGITRATEITAHPPPEVPAAGDRLRFPAGPVELRYRLTPAPATAGLQEVHAAAIEIDGDAAPAIARSLLDLRMLRSAIDGDQFFAAGVPWYATLFGRDSLLTASQMLPWAPEVAAQTLRLLARRIGRRDDPLHEEDPGKILHELRVGEAAAPGATPLARYYGTVDATSLWLCLLCDHAEWTGDSSLFRELQPAIEAMLGWIDGPGDRDGDGLLDYAARGPHGLRNQGWKDSDDGIVDEHGSPLEPPIALLEAQAYAIRAKRGLARLYARQGDRRRAAALAAQARRLALRVERRFWLGEEGFYAMALDRDGRPSRALASNQGHLLWAVDLPAARARAVRDALMSERMFSGWGIRTLATGEAAYDPLGYHVGTVWPHDTALAAAGLRRHGFGADFGRIADALFDVAAAAADARLPELLGGRPRTAGTTPQPFPVACRPQAWAAGTLPNLLACSLGLRGDGFAGRLGLRDPVLPRGIDRLRVSDLRVGGGAVDVALERVDERGAAAVTHLTVRGEVTLAR